MPRSRCRIDELAERLATIDVQPQKKPSRESRRRSAIRLRFATIGEDGIEDMHAETGFGRMHALPVVIAKQRVKPAVGAASVAEVVYELHVSVSRWRRMRRVGGEEFVDIDRHGMAAWQSAEKAPGRLPAGGVVNDERSWQVRLSRCHRRRQHDRTEAVDWQNRRRDQVSLAHQSLEIGNPRIRDEVVALDVSMRHASSTIAMDYLIPRPHEMPACAYLDLLWPALCGQKRGDVDGI